MALVVIVTDLFTISHFHHQKANSKTNEENPL
jgi:hypothetical protein